MKNEFEKSMFIIGAGAEMCYGLPSGYKYTKETYIDKKKEISAFVKNNYPIELCYSKRIQAYTVYFSETPFKSICRSSLLATLGIEIDINESIFLANVIKYYSLKLSTKPQECYNNADKILSALNEDIVEQLDRLIKMKKISIEEEIIKEKVIDIIKNIVSFDCYEVNDKSKDILSNINENFKNILDVMRATKNDETGKITGLEQQYSKEELRAYDLVVESIFKNFRYYGFMEYKFSSIISRQQNPTNFYKLMYYYWSCFDAIARPIYGKVTTDLRRKNIINSEKSIKAIITDINEIFKLFIDSRNNNDLSGRLSCYDISNYYKAIQEMFGDNIRIATTNYTPFILRYFDDKNISWLAGRLDYFESLETLTYYKGKLAESAAKDNSLFPFMMSQAPIKPVICANQIKDYNNFLTSMQSSDNIFILGYSLSKNDSHIISMIRERIVKDKVVTVYYLKYCSDLSDSNQTDIKQAKEEILRKFNLNDTKYADRIQILIYGIPNGVDNKDKNLINEYSISSFKSVINDLIS